MTDTDIAPTNYSTPPVAMPERVGQATVVEQSRAVAEVQASVLVAQSVPRSMDAARAEFRVSCEFLEFADRAFYNYKRGGNVVEGPSVYFAREAARCFRNVQYGIDELDRDAGEGRSQMRAWAWDLETNTRAGNTFIVPHARDVGGKIKNLETLRDVYENNANMGARRLRAAILGILPDWFTQEAENTCRATLRRGDGSPIEDRQAAAVRAFADLGVDQGRIEQKLGHGVDKWTVYDLAQLRITLRSIQRGELPVDDAFPAAKIAASDLPPAPAPVADVAPTASDPVEEPETAEAETPAPEKPEPSDPIVSGEELRKIIASRNRKNKRVSVSTTLKAVQAEFPDASLATIEDVAADPQALDWALGWIDNDRKATTE